MVVIREDVMLNLDRANISASCPKPIKRHSDTIVLGRIGSLITRLALSKQEIEAAQALRYRVFFDDQNTAKRAIDHDRFDAMCDHLIVIDTSLQGPDTSRIVGTYRLLPQSRASKGFYSASEYDVEALIGKKPERHFLELGRSCVLESYRSKRTAELLWQGIWAYSLDNGNDVLMGCASFSGTIPAAHAMALSYLHHHHSMGQDWSVNALPERAATMDFMPQEAVNLREAIRAMPPLIKAYMRVGAMVGNGCVVDYDFGTTDIFILLPVEMISQKYIRHYGPNAQRFAA